MSASSDIAPGSSVEASADVRAALLPTRPLYWSVRRELWENRSIVMAPVAVSAVVLFGFAVGHLGHSSVTTVRATTSVVNDGTVTQATHVAAAVSPAERVVLAAIPYDFAAMAAVVTLFIVAVFYCLGALHNERRDRSILFWKSLPVSDLTTVSSKALVPLAVLPAVALAIAVATQFLMRLMSSMSLAAHGKAVTEAWTLAPLGSMVLVLLYGMAALTLWWAPIYAWLLLVSGWARRAPFLWAVLPPLLLALGEKIAFNTGNVWSLILYRIPGGLQQAFVVPTQASIKAGTAFPEGLPLIDLGKFVSTPGLWTGLAVAAALFAGAVWLRRYREPI